MVAPIVAAIGIFGTLRGILDAADCMALGHAAAGAIALINSIGNLAGRI